VEFLPLLALPVLVVAGLAKAIEVTAVWIAHKVTGYRRHRRDRLEAELDRRQAELRERLLQLAIELNNSGFDARTALIRESFLARSQQAPDGER